VTFHTLKALRADCEGKALKKLTLGVGVLALGAAMSSPEFEAVPFAGKAITRLRNHLPDTLDKITNALSRT